MRESTVFGDLQVHNVRIKILWKMPRKHQGLLTDLPLHWRLPLLSPPMFVNEVRHWFLDSDGRMHTSDVWAIELLEFPNDKPIAYRSGGVTVTPLSSSVLIM